MLQKNATPRFALKTVVGWFLAVTPLILAAVALLVGLPAGYRYVERGLSVLVVGALVTGAAMLPEKAWSESRLGLVIWRVGCVGAWAWVLVAILTPMPSASCGTPDDLRMTARRDLYRLTGWPAARRPSGSDPAGRYCRVLDPPTPSGTDTRTARLLIATAAVAAVAALPSPAFEHLPWAVRVNDALHGAFASLWTGPLVFLLVFVAWARVDRPVRRRADRRPQAVGRVKDRPFQQGHVRPSSPPTAT